MGNQSQSPAHGKELYGRLGGLPAMHTQGTLHQFFQLISWQNHGSPFRQCTLCCFHRCIGLLKLQATHVFFNPPPPHPPPFPEIIQVTQNPFSPCPESVPTSLVLLGLRLSLVTNCHQNEHWAVFFQKRVGRGVPSPNNLERVGLGTLSGN